MQAFLDWIAQWRIGDLASILGLLVSIIGFAITIVAALAAKAAAQNARDVVMKTIAIATCSQALSVMDEIKRLHRTKTQWAILPDRYATLRNMLVALRTSEAGLRPEQRRVLLGAAQQFSDMEDKVEQALESDLGNLSVAGLNKIVSSQIDRVHEILSALQQDTRKISDG